jgi:hypothetical protein
MAYKRYERVRRSRCGYCGGVGHNRSTCKEFKAEIQRRLDQNPDDVHANILIDHEKAKKARRANKKRKCTFCGEQGHNRATCAHLKKEVEAIAKINIAYRKRFLGIMNRLQISEFMLATSERAMNKLGDPSEHYRIPLVLKSINWGNINYWNRKIVWPERHSLVFNFQTLPLVEDRHLIARHCKFHFSTFNDPEMIELTSGRCLEDSKRLSDWWTKGVWPRATSVTGQELQAPASWLDLKAVKKEIKQHIKEVGLTIENFHPGNTTLRPTSLQKDFLNIVDSSDALSS